MDRKPNQAGAYKRKKKKKESDRCCKTNQVGIQVGGDDQKDENYTDAATNTKEVTSFLVWAYTKKKQKRKKSKKIEKKKIRKKKFKKK